MGERETEIMLTASLGSSQSVFAHTEISLTWKDLYSCVLKTTENREIEARIKAEIENPDRRRCDGTRDKVG